MRFRFGDVEFGGLGSSLIVSGFDPGSMQVRSQDEDAALRDGVLPGKDFFGGATWRFDLVTNGASMADALAVDAALSRAWKDAEVRLTPLATVPLSYEVGGRWRRVYGRPDAYIGLNGDVRAAQGGGRITADFRVLDPRHYSDEERSTRLSIVPASTGGLRSPLVAPLSTTRSSAPRAGLVSNDGDYATALAVTFHGPVSDPWVRSARGWEAGLIGALAYDQSVTLDGRTGTVLRQDGAPVPGMVSRATRMSRLTLPPGGSELTFGGTDPTGTAYVDLTWRHAYSSI